MRRDVFSPKWCSKNIWMNETAKHGSVKHGIDYKLIFILVSVFVCTIWYSCSIRDTAAQIVSHLCIECVRMPTVECRGAHNKKKSIKIRQILNRQSVIIIMDVKHLPVSFLRKRCHYIYHPVFQTDTCHCNRSVRLIMQSTSKITWKRKDVKNGKFSRHFKIYKQK